MALIITPELAEAVPLSYGVYNARVAELALGQWEGKEGKPDLNFLKVKLEVYGSDNAADNGKAITYNAPITGKGAFKLMDLWEAATGEKLDASTGELDAEQIQGKEVRVTLGEAKDQQGNVMKFPEVKKIERVQ